jgi:type IV secretory pathway TrbD component
MRAVHADLSRESLIRLVGNRLSAEDRAEYYRMLRLCRSLPENDELLIILNAIHLLPLLTIDLPGQIASEREKIEQLLRSAAEEQKKGLQSFEQYQCKFEHRIASLPEDVAKRIQPDVIAALVTENIRQQFDRTAIPETAKLLRAEVDDMNTAGVELRKLRTAIMDEARGFLAALESKTSNALTRAGEGAQRIAALLEDSIGALIGLTAAVCLAVGIVLGIWIDAHWFSSAPPAQPVVTEQSETPPVAPASETQQKSSIHRK